MNVLVVGPKAPPFGGIQRFAENLIHIKSDDVVFYLFSDNIPGHWRPKTRTNSFTWNFIKRDGIIASFKVLLFVVFKYIEFIYNLFKHDINCVHILSSNNWGFFRNSIYSLLAVILRKRCVFHHLGQIDEMIVNSTRARLRIIKILLKLPDVHVTQSIKLSELLSQFTELPVKTIYNPVDPIYYKEIGQYKMCDISSGINFISVGYLGHSKGTFDILEMVFKNSTFLRDRGARFKIIGGGEVNYFREKVLGLAINDLVEVMGELSDTQKYNALTNWANVFLLPSHAEGQPIAVLEAMASSLPVIVGRVGSLPEFIEPTMGYLVTPGDLLELENAVFECIENKDLLRSKGVNCKLRIQAYHGLDKFHSDILALY